MRRLKKQAGVAILLVLVTLAIVFSVTMFFARRMIVDSYYTDAQVQRLQAEMLARSSMNVAEMVIRLQTNLVDGNDMVQAQLGTDNITDFVYQLMFLFSPSEGELEDRGLGSGIEGLTATTGQIEFQVETDDGKVNLNCANQSAARIKALETALLGLFGHNAYDELFQNPDASGWTRDRREQIAALIDFVDRDDAKHGAPGQSEQYGYRQLDDGYDSHDNNLDTIDQIRMVRGVDDDFWTLFGGEFTVYGDCRVNIGQVQSPKVIASLIVLGAKDPNDPVIADPIKLWKLASQVSQTLGLPSPNRSLKDFVDTVKDPTGGLLSALGQDAAAAAEQLGLEQVQGVELVESKLSPIVYAGPRRTYRVVANGFVPWPGKSSSGDGEAELANDGIRRQIVGVFDTKVLNQNVYNGTGRLGAWVYWRED